MATGRVGGTKSKIAGKVGNSIYRIGHDDNGVLQQVVSAAPSEIKYSNTEKQAAQRMFTGMVQGLMAALRPIATISNEYAIDKSHSLNAFSSTNIIKVRQDAKEHWDDSTSFCYPYKAQALSEYPQVGGYWSISLGSLSYELFDWCGEDNDPYLWTSEVPYFGFVFSGLKMMIPSGNPTLRDFMIARRMTRRDSLHFVWWETATYWYEGVDNPDEKEGFHYLSVSVNPYLHDSAKIKEVSINDIFIVNSSRPVSVILSRDGSFFAFGRMQDRLDNLEEVGWLAGFSISYPKGKKLVSSSQLRNPSQFDPSPFMVSPPANVFGSWIGKGINDKWPSPL